MTVAAGFAGGIAFGFLVALLAITAVTAVRW